MNTEDMHCIRCGQKGTLAADSEVVKAWIKWQDEDNVDSLDWHDGPEDAKSLHCSSCHEQFYVGQY